MAINSRMLADEGWEKLVCDLPQVSKSNDNSIAITVSPKRYGSGLCMVISFSHNVFEKMGRPENVNLNYNPIWRAFSIKEGSGIKISHRHLKSKIIGVLRIPLPKNLTKIETPREICEHEFITHGGVETLVFTVPSLASGVK